MLILFLSFFTLLLGSMPAQDLFRSVSGEVRAGRHFGVDLETKVTDAGTIFFDARREAFQIGGAYKLLSLKKTSSDGAELGCDVSGEVLGGTRGFDVVGKGLCSAKLASLPGFKFSGGAELGTFYAAIAGVEFDRISLSGKYGDGWENRLDLKYSLGKERKYAVSAGYSNWLGYNIGVSARWSR